MAVKRLLPAVQLQLILVNDGSERNFGPEEVTFLQQQIPGILIVSYAVNRGKGHAIREGLLRAMYSCQVCTDLDFPFGVEVVKTIFDSLEQGADIVAGERGRSYLALLPLKRRIVTLISRAINRFVLRMPLYDAQAGIKGFNAQGRAILERTKVDGFLYDSEFIFKAGRKQLNIRAIPVHCRPGIRFSAFRMKLLWREVRNYLKFFSL
jgi:glycosyltransferase involved in cell wall biosynthesis